MGELENWDDMDFKFDEFMAEMTTTGRLVWAPMTEQGEGSCMPTCEVTYGPLEVGVRRTCDVCGVEWTVGRVRFVNDLAGERIQVDDPDA